MIARREVDTTVEYLVSAELRGGESTMKQLWPFLIVERKKTLFVFGF